MHRSAALAGIAGLLLALLAAAPVGAFELNGGCNLTLTSNDESGATVDTASGGSGGGSGGTHDDPFVIDWEGTVSWSGDSGSLVFRDHSWQTFVFLVPIPVRGGDPNEGEDTTAEGAADVDQNAPFKTSGLYYVSGVIDGAEGAHCDGSGWFKLDENAVETIPFWLAVLIAVAGLVVLYTARPHVMSAVR
jgi:hypothetical protein